MWVHYCIFMELLRVRFDHNVYVMNNTCTYLGKTGVGKWGHCLTLSGGIDSILALRMAKTDVLWEMLDNIKTGPEFLRTSIFGKGDRLCFSDSSGSGEWGEVWPAI